MPPPPPSNSSALALKAAAETYRNYLNDKLRKDASSFEDRALTQNKLTAMNDLCTALGNASQATQLQAFRTEFTRHRALLETRRDTGFMTFLKVVASCFSLGLAVAFGIWNVKGEGEMKKMEAMLPLADEQRAPQPQG